MGSPVVVEVDMTDDWHLMGVVGNAAAVVRIALATGDTADLEGVEGSVAVLRGHKACELKCSQRPICQCSYRDIHRIVAAAVHIDPVAGIDRAAAPLLPVRDEIHACD